VFGCEEKWGKNLTGTCSGVLPEVDRVAGGFDNLIGGFGRCISQNTHKETGPKGVFVNVWNWAARFLAVPPA
jgi:hypothetical protein